MGAETTQEHRSRNRLYALLAIVGLLVLGAAYSLGIQPERGAARKLVTAHRTDGAAERGRTGGDDGGKGWRMGSGRSPLAPMWPGRAAPAPPGPPGFGAGAAPMPQSRMVIRTASPRLRTNDVGEAHDEVMRTAREAQGYVADTTFRAETGPTHAMVTIRVPSRGMDSVIAQISELGELLHKQIRRQEVTEEYVDLGSRRRDLEREEEQLLALLKRAGKGRDLLEVEQALGRVRREIERVAGRMRYLENRVELSTVTLHLQVPEPQPTAGGPV